MLMSEFATFFFNKAGLIEIVSHLVFLLFEGICFL